MARYNYRLLSEAAGLVVTMLRTRVAAVLSVIVVLSIPFILAANPVAAREPFEQVDFRVNGLHAASGTASVDGAAIFDTIYYAHPDSGDNGQDSDQVVAGLDFYVQGALSNRESVLSLGEEITTCSSQTLSALEMYDSSLCISDINSDVATVTGTPANQDADTDDSDDADSGSGSDPSSSSDINDATCSGTFQGIQTPSSRNWTFFLSAAVAHLIARTGDETMKKYLALV